MDNVLKFPFDEVETIARGLNPTSSAEHILLYSSNANNATVAKDVVDPSVEAVDFQLPDETIMELPRFPSRPSGLRGRLWSASRGGHAQARGAHKHDQPVIDLEDDPVTSASAEDEPITKKARTSSGLDPFASHSANTGLLGGNSDRGVDTQKSSELNHCVHQFLSDAFESPLSATSISAGGTF